jgi:hypothetical protein
LARISPYKAKQIKNFLDNKLRIRWNKGGKELKGRYYLADKKVLKVYIPHQHGGGKGDSLTDRVVINIINNLKVTKAEFNALYECPMTGTEYESKIRGMGLL